NNPNDLYWDQQESHYVFINEGTTGINNVSFWNIGYLDDQTTVMADVLKQLGISQQDRVLNLLMPGISGAHFIFNLALEKTGVTIIPLGGESELPVIAHFTNDLQPTVVIGNPTTLISVLEHLSNNQKFSVETIIAVGANLSPTHYKFLQKHSEKVYFPIFFSLETGIIGTQCPSLPVGTFHLVSNVYVELIDPKSETLTNSNHGEILVTTLLNRASPCIRYRLGAHISFLEKTCNCDNSTPLFKLRGGVNDAVELGGTD
ncbi:MAG: hypothetical protein ACFFBD_17310, partial [Candidatus Hodarchaeota archaeon]